MTMSQPISKNLYSPLLSNYHSVVDFSATYTSSTTITCAGGPFAIDDTVSYVSFIGVRPTGKYETIWFVNRQNGVRITATANVITIAGAGTPFAASDTYFIGVLAQEKGYVAASDSFRFSETDPLDLKVAEESLYDGTNTSSDLYLPSEDGMMMLGYKSLSLTGKIIEADAENNTITVQGSNDEDVTPASRDWISLGGYRTDLNAITFSVVCNATTTTFGWDFDNLNYKYVRVFFQHPASHTNTLIIKARRCAL